MLASTAKKKILAKLSIWVLVAGFCSAQVYQISSKYFARETVTEVQVAFPPVIAFPKLVFCSPQFGVITRTRNISSVETLNLMTCGSPAQILPGQSVVDKFKPQKFQYRQPNIPNPTTADAFLMYGHVCFTGGINQRLNNWTIEQMIGDAQGAGFIVTISNDILVDMSWRTYAASPNTNVYAPSSAYIIFFPRPRTTYYLSYARIENRRLTWPYSSNCVNYTQRGYQSQSHCFNECMLTTSIARHGLISFTSVANRSLNYAIPHHGYSPETQRFLNSVPQIEQRCKRRCKKQDCVQEKHLVAFVGQRKQLPWMVEPQFMAGPPNTPDTVTVEKPLIDWIDYVTYVLSAIGFWFAFSPLTFMMRLARVQ